MDGNPAKTAPYYYGRGRGRDKQPPRRGRVCRKFTKQTASRNNPDDACDQYGTGGGSQDERMVRKITGRERHYDVYDEIDERPRNRALGQCAVDLCPERLLHLGFERRPGPDLERDLFGQDI